MQRRHCRHPHEWHLLNFRAQHHSCDQLQWSDLLKRQVPDKPWGFTINVNKRFCEILDQINVFFRFSIVSWSTFFVYGRCYRRSPAHNRLSHILEKNEVPDTLNGFLVKYEDATIIIPDSTLPGCTCKNRPTIRPPSISKLEPKSPQDFFLGETDNSQKKHGRKTKIFPSMLFLSFASSRAFVE